MHVLAGPMAQWLNKNQVLGTRRKKKFRRRWYTSARVQFTSRAYVIRKIHYGVFFFKKVTFLMR